MSAHEQIVEHTSVSPKLSQRVSPVNISGPGTGMLLQLQSLIGNRAVTHLLSPVAQRCDSPEKSECECVNDATDKGALVSKPTEAAMILEDTAARAGFQSHSNSAIRRAPSSFISPNSSAGQESIESIQRDETLLESVTKFGRETLRAMKRNLPGEWGGIVVPDDERRELVTLLNDIGVTPTKFGSVAGAKFLLHDTSGAGSRAHLEAEAKKARGPLGSGPNVFVPPTGLEVLQRPDFFDPRRPTTTEHEKGEDLVAEAGRATALRKVWKATDPAVQAKALDDSLSGLPLSPKEVADEKKDATSQLNASSGKIFTTAHWAVTAICRRQKAEGAAKIAVKGKEADLESGCKVIGPILETREQRVRSTVSVELVQVGVKKGAKNLNTCDPSNPDALPLPDPPYSDAQYWNTALMYIRAAVAAGVWPMTTTHFVEDAFDRGHCDPRCFDLQRFYDQISALVGHGKGSTYGVKPKYGTKAGTDSVWWDTKVCHRGPP